MTLLKTCGVALLVLGVPMATSQAAQRRRPLDLKYRWVYSSVRFEKEDSVTRLLDLLERAAGAKYNGAVVIDGAFGNITDRPPVFFENMKRVRAAAERLRIELIPAVFHYMYRRDPSWAEGMPVRDCLFEARGGLASVAGRRNLLTGGGLDQEWGPKGPPGFSLVDGPGISAFRDTEVKYSGAASMRWQDFDRSPKGGNLVRLVVLDFELEPWQQYLVRVWMKSEGLDPPRAAVVFRGADNGRALNYNHPKLRPTQDWREYRVVFNSMENRKAYFDIGIKGRSGKLWIDEVSVEKTAGLGLIRREGCPVRVTSEDGRVAYAEGRDFEPWSGGYVNKGGGEAVTDLRLKAGTRIREGQRLKVSFFHTASASHGAPTCLSLPAVFEYQEELARSLAEHLGAKKFHMMHNSELRVAGWCELCAREGRTTGELVAENANRTLAGIRRACPGAWASVWSDMFDPVHNARPGYYLTANTMERSWEIDPSIRILIWYEKDRVGSLKFFGKRGNKAIIATYYDYPGWQGALERWLDAAREAGNVEGVLYTTWRNKHDDIERFSELVDRYTAGD